MAMLCHVPKHRYPPAWDQMCCVLCVRSFPSSAGLAAGLHGLLPRAMQSLSAPSHSHCLAPQVVTPSKLWPPGGASIDVHPSKASQCRWGPAAVWLVALRKVLPQLTDVIVLLFSFLHAHSCVSGPMQCLQLGCGEADQLGSCAATATAMVQRRLSMQVC